MSILKYVRRQLNSHFIKNNTLIVGEMQKHYREHGRPETVVMRMRLILKLFVKYAVLKKNPLRVKQKKMEKQIYPESKVNAQITESVLLEKMEKTDFIIFDLWDVLVCPVLDRRHIWALFETMIGSPGISDYSDSAILENRERRNCLKNIVADFCLDNTYMHRIWNCAKSMGKQVFLHNNSAFENPFIEEIAGRFAYTGKIYQGDLHGGLYITADAKSRTGILYKNVNLLGEPYRPFYQKNIITDFYSRVINLKFHAGHAEKSIFYEYGFACGGILTCGFCQYLNELVRQEKIDKLLFVARDGDIIKKVYDRYFKDCDTAYLYFSRVASYELIFEDFPEEYIDKNVKKVMGTGGGEVTVRKLLQECDLLCMESYLEEKGLAGTEKLNVDSYRRLKKLVLESRDRIKDEFRDSAAAAKQYFMQEIQGYKNVCVVDLGWRGTSAVYLRHLFKKYGWRGSVKGAIIGAALDDVTQVYVRNGLLYTYAFDSELFRGCGADNGTHMLQEELFCIEALFSSDEPTLLRYQTEADGSYGFIFDGQNIGREITVEIQKGIMDYAGTCAPVLQKYHLRILPKDAYTPLDFCMRNGRYRKMIGQAWAGEIERK